MFCCYWLRSFSKSAPTHLRKSGLATPNCAAWRRRSLFSVYHRHHEYSWCLWCLLVKEGVVCGALCTVRGRDTTPTMTRNICVFFFTGLDQSRLTNLDRSRFVRFWKRTHSLSSQLLFAPKKYLLVLSNRLLITQYWQLLGVVLRLLVLNRFWNVIQISVCM